MVTAYNSRYTLCIAMLRSGSGRGWLPRQLSHLFLKIKNTSGQPFDLFEIRQIKGDGGNGYPVFF